MARTSIVPVAVNSGEIATSLQHAQPRLFRVPKYVHFGDGFLSAIDHYDIGNKVNAPFLQDSELAGVFSGNDDIPRIVCSRLQELDGEDKGKILAERRWQDHPDACQDATELIAVVNSPPPSLENAVYHMKLLGYRPATRGQAFAFVHKYPEVLEDARVVVVGSDLLFSNGLHYVTTFEVTSAGFVINAVWAYPACRSHAESILVFVRPAA